MKSKYEHLREAVIDSYVNGLMSMREIKEKYGIKNKTFISDAIKGYTRSASERDALAHKKHPEKFIHSESTKNKMREKRLKYLSEHPENTAWRRTNMSYPEKKFIEYLMSRGLDKIHSIEREKSFFPYYVDFAFNDIQLAVEIDGSQHLLPDRKQKDEQKDALLNSLGWKVLRITENTVKHEWSEIDNVLLQTPYEVLNNNVKIGIFKIPKTYVKKERNEYGRTVKQTENDIRSMKVERPSKDELYDLVKTKPFTHIAKMYGVSDKTVAKWCKRYNLPYRKKDIILTY